MCRIPLRKVHRVPHITLYGNFVANGEQAKKVAEVLEAVGKTYSFLPYLIDGFRWVEGKKGKVIYFNIVPSHELKQFRRELAERLLKIVPFTSEYDRKGDDFLFHSTLAFKLSEEEFHRAWSYVSCSQVLPGDQQPAAGVAEDYTMRYFYLPLNALRVTLLDNNSRIICEYDFLRKELLPRKRALSVKVWQETLRLFRLKTGIEGVAPDHRQRPPYLIGDLHLDHANIIHYCARPFVSADVEEMNRVLIDNWNHVVGHNTVYFLGDLSFGRGARPSGYWLQKLAGDIHFIKGNHEAAVRGAKDYEFVDYGGYRFLLVHDPANLPFRWDGWVIHAHKHNNDMKNYPFINGEKKTINVSAELVNYKPVSLDFIVQLNLDSIRRMDTIDSSVQR